MMSFVEASELWLAGQALERQQQLLLQSAQHGSQGSVVLLLEAGPEGAEGDGAGAPGTDQIGDQMQRCSIGT